MRFAKWLSVFLASGMILLALPFLASAQQGVSGYTVITAVELKKLLENEKDTLLIDNLAVSRFKQEHLPGARHFEFPNENMDRWDKSKTDGKTQEDFTGLLGGDKDRPIVFYCLDSK